MGSTFSKRFWKKTFPVNGQGTVIFNEQTDKPFVISVENNSGNGISLCVNSHDEVTFVKHANGVHEELTRLREDGRGFENRKIAYRYSYDRDNLVLKYGKGYRMEETTIMTHDFLKGAKTPDEEKQIRKELYPFFNAEEKIFARIYKKLFLSGEAMNHRIIKVEPTVEFEKCPFVCNVSPLVLHSSKVNMFLLDDGDYVFSSSLPAACQELFNNVYGCDLNCPEEVESVHLSDAIRYSIETKGCILNNKLKEKAGEFGPKNENTYLRVTLGHSLGRSPGIPYVLEIWPSGHFSPIHNHGNANAVIKVLHGSIHISIYNKQTTDPNEKPLKEFDAHVGDVTWINRNWYQTHKLHNVTDDFCATIQCYKYDSGDTTYWPYFDYVSDNKTIEKFLPNSDFKFREMRKIVLEEYAKRKLVVSNQGASFIDWY
ncbi:uncharacterized protein LOC141899145 [Tubulanus polymorphus]|uniref:uncharacterized protein LOC141899145 n=1 Tax=Tubulanus polymorphus TaxID=672921 RepID=UPI003DA6BE86